MTNTTTKNINVMDKSGSQKLILKNTVINGEVSFSSGKGKIVMDNSSKINGKIHGGVIEEKLI